MHQSRPSIPAGFSRMGFSNISSLWNHAETAKGLSFPVYTLHTIALFALFGHGDTFARHDVPLMFGIKCCPIFGGSRTTTSLGVTICFVICHIICSALLGHVIVDSQPLILNTSEYNGTVSSEGTHPSTPLYLLPVPPLYFTPRTVTCT